MNEIIVMNKQDLLKTRFELIADYPGNSQPIGNVTIEDTTASYFRKFTSNFRELFWWEKRIIEQMPKYLKCKSNYNTEIWVVYPASFSKEGDGWTCHVEKSIIPPGNYLNDKLPATEAEYLSYQQYLDGKKEWEENAE